MLKNDRPQKRYLLILLTLAPLALLVSFMARQRFDIHNFDFTHFWLAGHMNLAGLDVYGPNWVMERLHNGIQWIPEQYFLYPLPLSVLLSPLGLMTFENAYLVWVTVAQLGLLAAAFILMEHYFARDAARLELLTLAGLFLFRPFFIVVVGGQIDPYILMFIVLAGLAFKHNRPWLCGLALALTCLKPSLGVSIIFFSSLWLLLNKRGRALGGLALGLLLLFLIGAARDPAWVNAYLAITRDKFSESYGLHSTLWGFASLLPLSFNLKILSGLLLTAIVLGVVTYLLIKNYCPDLFGALAVSLPATLLVAPYAWVYNQILLIVPLIFILSELHRRYGLWRTGFFIFGLDILSILLALWAYRNQHDVWSILVSLTVWLCAVVFTIQKTAKRRTAITPPTPEPF